MEFGIIRAGPVATNFRKKPAVNCVQPRGYKGQACEMSDIQAFSQSNRTDDDRTTRYQECNEQKMGRPGRRENAEVQHVAECGRENRAAGDGLPNWQRRHRQSPGMIDQHRDWKQHDRGSCYLAGGRQYRVDAHELKTTAVHPRESVKYCRG